MTTSLAVFPKQLRNSLWSQIEIDFENPLVSLNSSTKLCATLCVDVIIGWGSIVFIFALCESFRSNVKENDRRNRSGAFVYLRMGTFSF